MLVSVFSDNKRNLLETKSIEGWSKATPTLAFRRAAPNAPTLYLDHSMEADQAGKATLILFRHIVSLYRTGHEIAKESQSCSMQSVCWISF
jgi:hypothetical protein